MSSVEDHGYLVNVGIPNTTAFLSKSPDVTLKPCDVVMATVKSATESSVILGEGWFAYFLGQTNIIIHCFLVSHLIIIPLL